ncbi:prefoldin subunit 6 [Gregarina niphandrodes]|uniref:Prefoldin subunit 6 n=1 Tax=Gregarina niphandrodes TaxID=110365 RepID=A0A023B304_GRENI|nr:prefoldin subunit 6 [Gregarina niphandrodes]EZG55236.1 prefoldin subunit 6 [Gregarina niphandrodes]|eukprot:XP_011131687.1 prefoldin subunit 6 [Gregarina niphandrodes]
MASKQADTEALKRLTDEYRELQERIQTAASSQAQLGAQESENKIVLEELQDLEDDAQVFKLVGNVLMKQNTKESVENVTKRLSYIQEELKRSDEIIQANKNALDKLVSQIQAMQ